MDREQEGSSVNMVCLSLVVPCFNEEASIPVFYEEIVKICVSTNDRFELIFVDDGSSDNSLYILRQLANQDNRIHYISLSRNFGKEAALLAGLHAALLTGMCLFTGLNYLGQWLIVFSKKTNKGEKNYAV